MPRQVDATLPCGESRLAIREASAHRGVMGPCPIYELQRAADGALAS